MSEVNADTKRSLWLTPWPYIVILMLMFHASLIIGMVYFSMQTPVNLIPRATGS